MTIAAGFVVRDGILLCADSQYSGWEKVYKPKLFNYPFGASMVSFAFCGDEAYGRMAIDDCFEAIMGIPQEQHTLWNIRRTIRRSIKRVVDEFAKRDSLDQTQKPEVLVAINTPSSSIGYLFSSRDSALSRIDSFGFCGSAAYLANYIMGTLHPVLVGEMTIEQAAFIGHYILAMAKRHDAGCGGGSQFLSLRGMQGTGVRSFSDFDASDEEIYRYERWSKILLMSACDPSVSETDFANTLEEFGKAATEIRQKLHSPGSQHWSDLLRDQENEAGAPKDSA